MRRTQTRVHDEQEIKSDFECDFYCIGSSRPQRRWTSELVLWVQNPRLSASTSAESARCQIDFVSG